MLLVELFFQQLEASQIAVALTQAVLTIVMGWVLAKILPVVASAILNFFYEVLVLLAVPVAFFAVLFLYRLIMIP